MVRKIQMFIATVAVLAVLAQLGCGGTGGGNSGGAQRTGTEFLYVGDTVGEINGFTIDPNSGTLTKTSDSPFSVTNRAAADSVSLAADPSGTALYATSKGLGGPNVVALSVNSTSGALSVVSNQTLPVTPGAIAVDPAAKNAYVIAAPENNLAQLFAFSIAPTTHALALLPSQPTALPGVPHDVAVDPSGAFVYVTFQGKAGDEVAGFSRDPSTGALAPLAGSPFHNTGGDSPQNIRFNPSGTLAVVVNQATSNISIMSLAKSSGALASAAGSPFATGNEPSAVAIDPSGKIVFVSNTGGDSLSAFTVSPAGALTPVAGNPVELGVTSQPGAIAVDPSGKFVYVSTVPRKVTGFSFDPNTGVLTPVAGSPFTGPNGPTRGLVIVKP